MGPPNGDRDRRVAVHEYVHLLVRYADTPMPLWMNEGVAELYSKIEQVKKAVQVGTPIPEHIFLIRNDWLPLAELVDVGHDSKYYNRRQHAGPFYGISWALVHMLTLDPRYKANFLALGDALANGVAPETAFQQVYAKSIAAIEKDLQTYVRGSTVPVVNYEVQFDKVDDKVAPRPVTDYEWGVATADLLIGVRKYDQAAARLEALTNMQPQRPEAWESLAFAKWINKQEGGAAFAKARSLGSVQPNLGYYAPAFSKDRAVIREALKAVVERYPAFGDARIRLAEQHLFGGDFQISFDTLKAIAKISRKQVPAYFPAFIQAAWYLGNLDEARGAASQFMKASRTEEEKERAKKWFAFAMKDLPKRVAAPVFTAEQTELRAPIEDDEVGVDEDSAVVRLRRKPAEQTEIRAPVQDREVGVDEDPTVIRLRRKPLTYATGALINLECKEPAVLHFRTETGVIKVVIDSPTAFQMVNAAEGKGDLACGEQSRPAKLGFYPKDGLNGGAAAVARSIEFLP
ncbi:MAG: tetratricopeptide repeat protein [Bryobacteraceae bacterium]